MADISPELKAKIDKWIEAKGRNEFGDPDGMMYAGGTPLFDERTGQYKDRYEYVLEKHPEVRNWSPEND